MPRERLGGLRVYAAGGEAGDERMPERLDVGGLGGRVAVDEELRLQPLLPCRVGRGVGDPRRSCGGQVLAEHPGVTGLARDRERRLAFLGTLEEHGEVAGEQGLFEFKLSLEWPERIIGDKAYDSESLDEELNKMGIELISPHRGNRKPENATQYDRPLRRYVRRWTVERTIA